MRLLYLDFDGVLHPDDVWHVLGIGPELRNVNGHHLFEHSDLLVALIGASDDVGVVLSTSWVFTYDLADVLFRLPDALRQRVVGSTFDAARHGPGFAPVARSHQVLDDVQLVGRSIGQRYTTMGGIGRTSIEAI